MEESTEFTFSENFADLTVILTYAASLLLLGLIGRMKEEGREV